MGLKTKHISDFPVLTSHGENIYVSPLSGNDSTGERGNPLKPFKHYQNAWNASSSGDTIVGLKGVSDEQVLMSNATAKWVYLFMLPGAEHKYTGSNEGALWKPTAVSGNALYIRGWGSFINSGTGLRNNAFGGYNYTNGLSMQFNIDGFDTIKSTVSQAIETAYVSPSYYIKNGNVIESTASQAISSNENYTIKNVTLIRSTASYAINGVNGTVTLVDCSEIRSTTNFALTGNSFILNNTKAYSETNYTVDFSGKLKLFNNSQLYCSWNNANGSGAVFSGIAFANNYIEIQDSSIITTHASAKSIRTLYANLDSKIKSLFSNGSRQTSQLQVLRFTPANVEVADNFKITLPDASFIQYTAAVASIADVTAGLTAAWNASGGADFTKFTAVDFGTYVECTADSTDKRVRSDQVTTTTTDGGGNNNQSLTYSQQQAALGFTDLLGGAGLIIENSNITAQ